MTAVDVRIAERVADVREQLAHFGQANPEDVRDLLDLVESTLARTGDLPAPVPFPLGGRSRWPVDAREDVTAPVIPLGGVCGARHPERSVLCGLLPRHAPADHVAYGEADRELGRWSS